MQLLSCSSVSVIVLTLCLTYTVFFFFLTIQNTMQPGPAGGKGLKKGNRNRVIKAMILMTLINCSYIRLTYETEELPVDDRAHGCGAINPLILRKWK